MRKFFQARPALSWALYDWGCTAFSTTVLAGFFPTFFRQYWSLGAVGQLQFEVVAFRLQDEYGVQCAFETIGVHTARWVYGQDERKLAEFRTKAYDNLAVDHSGALVYLAPSRVNLALTLERWPEIQFSETRESQG